MTVLEMDTQNTFDPLVWLGQQDGDKTKSTPPTVTPSPQPTACQRANIAENYSDFVRLGFALANGLGSDGRDLYHMLCAHSTKYRMADCERKWQECLRKSDGRTSIATFYHMARQAGVDLKAITKTNHVFHK